MHGMGLVPQSYDPLVDASDWDKVQQVMIGMRRRIASEVAACPTHDSFFPDRPRETTPARGWKQVERAGT